MPNPKISVIVPIYNVEKELRRCLDSILAQTFPDFELILVDDGSTDGCASICREYVLSDDRVRYFRKENGGLSSARNAGLKLAGADWITFIDSDDYVLSAFFSSLWDAVQKHNADIAVSCDYENNLSADKRSDILTGQEALRTMLYQRRFEVSAWGKLYRADLMKKYPYPEGHVYEDILPAVQMFYEAKTVAVIPKRLYCYIRRPDSISKTVSVSNWRDKKIMSDQMLRFVETNCPDSIPAALSKVFSNYCQLFVEYPRGSGEIDTEYAEVMDFLHHNAFAVCRDSHCRFKNRAAALMIQISPALFRRVDRFVRS